MKTLLLIFIWLFPIILTTMIVILKFEEIKSSSLSSVVFTTSLLLVCYFLVCGMTTWGVIDE